MYCILFYNVFELVDLLFIIIDCFNLSVLMNKVYVLYIIYL